MADGLKWALALALGWALAGCSSASESDDSPRFGKLVGGTGALPGPIAGLRYQSSTGTGFTAADGSFEFRPGDEIVFAVGDLELAPTKARSLVSPFQLANGDGCAASLALVAVLRLLQTLDDDGNLDDGIHVPELPAPPAVRRLSQLSDAELEAAILAISPGAQLVAPDIALDRFIRQVDDEAWEEEAPETFAFPDSAYRGQGVATDGKSWFFSSANHLQRTNSSFEVEVDKPVPIPADIFQLGGRHIGDIDVHEGKLYAPIEDGPEFLHPHVVLYDASTLEPTGERHALPAAMLTQGVPWVAVDGPRQLAYTAYWDPVERIYAFDLANDFESRGSIELSPPIKRIQGAKVFGGALYASSDDDEKSVYKIDLDTGAVMKLFALGTPTSEAEGLAPILRSDGLHLGILNVVLPDVVFTSWHRTRDPLRDAVCP